MLAEEVLGQGTSDKVRQTFSLTFIFLLLKKRPFSDQYLQEVFGVASSFYILFRSVFNDEWGCLNNVLKWKDHPMAAEACF